MLSVRLAKEAHFQRAAEDQAVPGERSIIRLGEPTTRSVRAIYRRFGLKTLRHASPRGSQNHSVRLTHEVATVRPSLIPTPRRRLFQERLIHLGMIRFGFRGKCS